MTDNESGCPSLPSDTFPLGMAVQQNLPSIVCGRVVDPQPGEIILDICAAPGNKTTHLSTLMNNEVRNWPNFFLTVSSYAYEKMEKKNNACLSLGNNYSTRQIFIPNIKVTPTL